MEICLTYYDDLFIHFAWKDFPDELINMTQAIYNIRNVGKLDIIIGLDVPKHLQLQRNE